MSSPRQILSRNALVNFYHDSLNDAETHTKAFWQIVFAVHFPAPDYLLVTESPPDASLRRADGVLRFNPDIPGESSIDLLWFECKHAFGSAREVEAQVLDAARRHLTALGLDADPSHEVYAMTAIGPTFRLWTVSGGFEGLRPFHGDARRNDKSQYLDAKSTEGCQAFFEMRDDIFATHSPSG